MFADTRIAFIGCGVMGEAMVRGLLDRRLATPSQLVATHPREERRRELAARYGVAVTGDNAEAAASAQVVVLTNKPQTLPAVLRDLRGHLAADELLLSIIAGTPIRKLVDGVGHAAVVRAMPNTPAQIGQGISVWPATPEVGAHHLAQARAILGSLGEEVHVDEEGYLDMATALSGSGPGYVFLFMEAMIDAGVHMGFSRRIATQLVTQTLRGSVEYAAQSDKHAAELRNQVTSPGGTTAAALYHMEKGGLRTVISRSIWAAYERSVALGRGKDTSAPHV